MAKVPLQSVLASYELRKNFFQTDILGNYHLEWVGLQLKVSLKLFHAKLRGLQSKQPPTQIACSCCSFHHSKESHKYVRGRLKQTEGKNCMDSKERQKTTTNKLKNCSKKEHINKSSSYFRSSMSRRSTSRRRLSSPDRSVQSQMEAETERCELCSGNDITFTTPQQWNSEGACTFPDFSSVSSM